MLERWRGTLNPSSCFCCFTFCFFQMFPTVEATTGRAEGWRGSLDCCSCQKNFGDSGVCTIYCTKKISRWEHSGQVVTPICVEMIQFDLRIFFKWVGSTTNQWKYHKWFEPKCPIEWNAQNKRMTNDNRNTQSRTVNNQFRLVNSVISSTAGVHLIFVGLHPKLQDPPAFEKKVLFVMIQSWTETHLYQFTTFWVKISNWYKVAVKDFVLFVFLLFRVFVPDVPESSICFPKKWTFPNQLVRLPLWKSPWKSRICWLLPDLFGGCLPSHGWVARWSYQQGSVWPDGI